MSNRYDATPSVGGRWAVVLFVVALVAFVAESELTQYVQTTLGFRHPYFLFFVVHSAFVVMFPIHLLFCMWNTRTSAHSLMADLSCAIAQHLSPTEPHPSFPYRKFLLLVLALTAGISFPALLWFASVTLSSISDVTAIWNTNAFFAYLITVKIFRLKWEPLRLVAVSIATLGVAAVVYGGSTSPSSEKSYLQASSRAKATLFVRPKAPLIGDMLTLIASIGSGFYQVMYKRYAALPSDPEVTSEGLYAQLPVSEEADPDASHETPNAQPPFGLHPNLLTSAIGLCTIAILWIPFPILHYLDVEPFAMPSNGATVLAIAGIALSGAVFNAGIMILLGVWGPIITSVGGLLTIVFIFVTDILISGSTAMVTVWSVMGAGAIVAAFGVLAYDMFNNR